jgi:hypothetical protein
MAIQLDESLMSIALGIRFRPNFSIEDQLGRIIDQILYSENSFFNNKIFPNVTVGMGSKTLIDPNTGDQITIDNSNIVLEIVFGDKFSIKDRQEILNHFENDIIKGIMKKFEIKEIARIGYVNRYLFKIEDLARKFIDKTIGNAFEGINDIKLTFSKKFPVPEGLFKATVNDYDNVIFTVIKKADLSEIFMSVDYQRLYDPFLSAVSQIEFRPFINQAEIFNQKGYLSWIEKTYLEGRNG